MPWNQKYLEELSNDKDNNSSIYGNEKNSQEKEIIELCKALKNLAEEIDLFFEENKLHKLYCENSTFFDIAVDNDRFCKFCLFRKVIKFIYINNLSLIGHIIAELVKNVLEKWIIIVLF